MKMNPGGVVPTLKHGYNIIPESDEILRYLDVHFSKFKIFCINVLNACNLYLIG